MERPAGGVEQRLRDRAGLAAKQHRFQTAAILASEESPDRGAIFPDTVSAKPP